MNTQLFYYLAWILIGLGGFFLVASIYIAMQSGHDAVITGAGLACVFAGWGIIRNQKKR